MKKTFNEGNMKTQDVSFVKIADHLFDSNTQNMFAFNRFKSTSNGIYVFFASIAPGEYIPPHIHPDPCDTYVYIISGMVRHYFGNKLSNKLDNGKSELIYIPPNIPHQPTNLEKSLPVQALVFCNYDQNDFHNAVPYDVKKDQIIWDKRGVDLEKWEHIRHIGPYE